jgi:hypothetical protein
MKDEREEERMILIMKMVYRTFPYERHKGYQHS